MDAVKFLKTLSRMCNCGCHKCEFRKRLSGFETCAGWRYAHPEEAVAIVEQWAAAHPVKTRQSVFLEQYPDANISDDGLPDVAPCQLCVGLIHGKSTEDCENRGLCKDCRREFWMQEDEE